MDTLKKYFLCWNIYEYTDKILEHLDCFDTKYHICSKTKEFNYYETILTKTPENYTDNSKPFKEWLKIYLEK